MSWFDEHRAEAEAAGITRDQAEDFLSRNRNPDGSSDEHRVIEALTNYTGDRAYDSQGPEINNGIPTAAQYTAGLPAGGSSAGRDVGFIQSFQGGGAAPSFGAPPEPFGETYTALGRPSWLAGPYTPLQWTGGDFVAPEKPNVLRTPYALPTLSDVEGSPGYLAAQNAMQRGLERSAAAKGTILSGGFVGRTLPRALGEYAGTAYQNLVGNTLAARGQQFGEYSTDVNNAFAQYQQRYGQFNDAATRDLGARQTNEQAFATDQASGLNQYLTRLNANQLGVTNKRNAENDLWSRNRDLSDLSLRAAALARP